MKTNFASLTLPINGALAVTVAAGGKLLASAASLDKSTGGALKRAISASRFSGKKGEILEIMAPSKVKNSRILLIGVGKPSDLLAKDLENLGGQVVGRLSSSGEKSVAIAADPLPGNSLSGAEQAARHAYGGLLRSYRFAKYRTKEKPEQKPSLASLSVLTGDARGARKMFAGFNGVAGGVFLTRDLVSEPANILFPKALADRAKDLTSLGVKVQTLGEKEMTKLGMGALLGVGQGSVRESQLLVMRWEGGPKAKGAGQQPVAFVGKGVCFDTGGISIKPAGGMEEMKWDMGGAGVVVGLMQALAARKAKVNVVGVCALVENMPDGNAQRPGDIVTSMSGQTIEVLNTDAEGRLVLADALWYTQEKFKPRMIVDLATLTGAIIIALGHEYAGLFSNNDELSEALSEAGKVVEEPVWRLPMGPAYDKQIDCDVADMKNISGGRAGGSITAAQFIQRFVKDGTPWAHLDIAAMAWSSKDKPVVPKGGTGFGVRLLDELVRAKYEA